MLALKVGGLSFSFKSIADKDSSNVVLLGGVFIDGSPGDPLALAANVECSETFSI